MSSEKNPVEEINPIIQPTVIPELTGEFDQHYFGKINHAGFKADDEKQKMVQYAYSLGGLDFVTLIECENGNRNIHAVGDSGKAYGLCQINTNYHRLPENFKTDWRVQIEECYRKRKGGTKFYGPSRLVKGKRCSSYVLDRFTIIE